jgi:ATP-dependent Lon protease
VLFPGTVLPIIVNRQRSIEAVQEAMRSEKPIGVVLQADPAVEEPDATQLRPIGTEANIVRYLTAPDGSHHLVCQGLRRFRIVEPITGQPFLAARVERLADAEVEGTEIAARVHHLKEQAEAALKLLPDAPPELIAGLRALETPSLVADVLASFTDLAPPQKQELLEELDLRARLDRLIAVFAQRIEVLKLSREIGEQTKESLGQQQREALLREQMRTIQRELGETGAKAAEIAELSEAIAKAGMPTEAEAQARKELVRLERMPEAAAEYSMIRTYLDWLIELPWSRLSEDAIDVAKAREILDADHFGLEKVKRRIVEYLAVQKLKPDGKSPVLCLVGPPGVGKTSLGQSVARATGRQFVRVSLGGTHDEAEIRGHRRTYVGALPGNVIQAIRRAGTRNPVLMLDEIDKLGAGAFHGDPGAALLEVLDPEQNHAFRDNYLGVPFDLSRAMFIATANVLDTIPRPLRDRLEIISLPGYTEEEKVAIARRYLVRRQLDANGLAAEQCEITDEALHSIVRDYTREAGVRNLEREIGSVFRHVAARIAEGAVERMRIEAGDLPSIIGPHRFENEVAMRTSVPGVATGLAWTPVGGDVLFVEATRMPGHGKLILTGQLGEVMRESAQAALSLLKANAAALGLAARDFDTQDIHVHVPAGAIPKDGPSAGVALYTALVSLMTDRSVRSDTAMTGEISLRGLVLPVGGIKEKVLAADAAGIKTVMLPARNRKDLDDIPESARQRLRLVWLERVEQAVAEAIGQTASGSPRRESSELAADAR